MVWFDDKLKTLNLEDEEYFWKQRVKVTCSSKRWRKKISKACCFDQMHKDGCQWFSDREREDKVSISYDSYFE